MNAALPSPDRRGLELLAVHCSSLDPDAPSARERLEKALGAEFARKLVLALSSAGSGSGSPDRERFAA